MVEKNDEMGITKILYIILYQGFNPGRVARPDIQCYVRVTIPARSPRERLVQSFLAGPSCLVAQKRFSTVGCLLLPKELRLVVRESSPDKHKFFFSWHNLGSWLSTWRLVELLQVSFCSEGDDDFRWSQAVCSALLGDLRSAQWWFVSLTSKKSRSYPPSKEPDVFRTVTRYRTHQWPAVWTPVILTIQIAWRRTIV